MKRILSVLFILVSFAAQAQNPVPVGAKNSRVYVQGLASMDSMFNLRLYDTATTKAAYPATATSPDNMKFRFARQNGRLYWNPTGTKFVYLDSVQASAVIDTISLSNRIDAKVGYLDTAAMLLNYAKKQTLIDTASAIQNRLNAKVGYADTAGMLANYQRSATAVKYADTAAMLANFTHLGNTTTGTGSTIVLSGSPTITLPNISAINVSGGIAALPTGSGTLAYRADSTGRFVTSVVKRNDSFFYVKAGVYVYFGKDSSGGAGTGVSYIWSSKITDHFEAAKITGVSDGAAVGTWVNTGKGTKTNLVADGTSPNYIANYRGMPAVQFVRASSTSMTFTNQAFKQCVVVCNNVDGSTFADYEGLMGNPTSGADWLWYADAASGTGMLQAGGDKLITQAFETSTNTFTPLSQTKITSFRSAAGISSRTTRVGAFWNLAGRFWNGYIQEIIFFSEILTKEEYVALHQYLTAKYAVYKPVQVFVDGNSLFSGGYTGVSASQSAGALIEKKADTATASKVYFYNAAVGGTVTDQNTFNAQQVTGINYRMNYQPLFGRQIVIPYSYTNQGFGVGAAAAYITDINEYVDVIKAANPNIEIWVPTPLSCDTTIYSESERQLVINYLTNKSPTKNFKPLVLSNPILYDPAAYANTTYFVDGIHITLTAIPIWVDDIIKQVFHYYAQE